MMEGEDVRLILKDDICRSPSDHFGVVVNFEFVKDD